MDTEKMKNMVVLRNLPSNIVDEAIVILKPNIKLKSLDKIERNNPQQPNAPRTPIAEATEVKAIKKPTTKKKSK